MKLKLTKDLILFDLETTGVETKTARIVQIAVIKYKTDGSKETKSMLINPEIPIPLEASEVHGITDDMVKDAPIFKKISKSLRAFIDGCDIGGFNSNSYDVPLLDEEFERVGLEPINWNPSFVDVMQLYRKLYSGKLSDIYQRFTGLELEDAHDALADVTATEVVLDKLLEQQDIEEISSEELDLYIQGEDNKRVDLAGCFAMKDGEAVWNFGKFKGKPVPVADSGYVNWFKNNYPTSSYKKYLEIIGK